MCIISATKDVEGRSGLVSVSGDDIIFLGTDSSSSIILLHTLSSVFYTTGTLKYWTRVLNASGYTFYLADRNNSINIRNIAEINNLLKIAYFERERTKDSKYCTMSKSGIKKVCQLVRELNPTVVFN
ncbi:LytTR family transcriptional regulator DNA-binding domain-containing protein [Paenibacillus sp. S150]|uniref:LytTR family transcriptional regulator DNA-binding domain-containing protein n=1 Tax=Paenibacillus sp. S150 TaxID=2749826 RepID=UPI001C58563F|nr:LytTR family transcriptional regulator DNA-binding domain-containing protein [Paenibacillus sp. S150]